MSTSSDGADGSGDEISTGSRVVEAIVLCIIISVSVIGNSSLWIVVLRSRALRTVTNMFILGLSAADLLVATVNMPLTVFTIIKGEWIFSESLCMAFGFINMLTLVGSVLSLCNISINRFFMVCRPGKFKDIYTTRNAILMIVATVTCAIFLSALPFFGWSEYVYTPTHSFCFADWVNHMSYAYFMIGCCFGIPLSVMTFCNISIIRSVRESRRKVKSTYRSTVTSTFNSINEDETHKEKKTCETVTTDIENSKFYSPSTITDLKDVRDNDNTGKNKAETINESHIAADSDLPKFDQVDNKENDKETQQSHVQDCVSDDSSNESNAALIGQIRRQSPRRNQLFSNENQNKDKIKSVFPTETPNIKPKQDNIDNTLLHPRWKSKSVESEMESSATMESSIENGNEKKTKPGYTPSVTLRSPVRTRRREEIRLAVSLIIVVLLFVICWLPYCISMLISIHYSGHIPREFHMFTLLIGYANSGCNPIVYGLMNQRFKVGFKRLFCFWKSHVFTLSSNS